MNRAFADTHYWLAATNRHDQFYSDAIQARKSLGRHQLYTTDEVLVEFMNFHSEHGPVFRKQIIAWITTIRSDPGTVVVPQSRASFNAGLSLYANRLDKGYSQTDCISMNFMRNEGIEDILTCDKHFAQEGFNVLYGE
jgi:predicted nucleic acid-binding protein